MKVVYCLCNVANVACISCNSQCFFLVWCLTSVVGKEITHSQGLRGMAATDEEVYLTVEKMRLS